MVMNSDAAAFILLCLLSRGTMPLSLAAGIAIGLPLIAAGIGIKSWAAKSLAPDHYYWRDFFFYDDAVFPSTPPGPYKYLRNPMYTVGYLHAYGFALVCRSWLGLAAAAFDQVAILLFHVLVEKPHVQRLLARASEGRQVRSS